MPYITPEARERLHDEINEGHPMPNTPGELNYFISHYIHEYIASAGLNYTTINEVIGVLECAKLELYRQIAVPYEDKKKAENGHISDLDKDVEFEPVSPKIESHGINDSRSILKKFKLKDIE